MKGTAVALAASAAAVLLFIVFQNPSMTSPFVASLSQMTGEGYLTGTVRTSDGAPFDNFKLIVYHKDSGALVKVVHTDASGKYGLSLNVGNYRVVTSQGTYEISIESGKTTTLNIPA